MDCKRNKKRLRRVLWLRHVNKKEKANWYGCFLLQCRESQSLPFHLLKPSHFRRCSLSIHSAVNLVPKK
ncbi:hypothetical protein L1887_11832 [Cichorium endivia]|nr:hypothetical protein L1887_11832 [Cichorium endivia]